MGGGEDGADASDSLFKVICVHGSPIEDAAMGPTIVPAAIRARATRRIRSSARRATKPEPPPGIRRIPPRESVQKVTSRVSGHVTSARTRRRAAITSAAAGSESSEAARRRKLSAHRPPWNGTCRLHTSSLSKLALTRRIDARSRLMLCAASGSSRSS